MQKNKQKLTTKLSTKVIMSVADVMCRVWKYGRKKYNGVSDFDYHITDLRKQYPNQLVYKHAISTLMPTGPIQLQDYGVGQLDSEELAE